MSTKGIVIWSRRDSPALIIWCADSGQLAYAADRTRVGDPGATLLVGDWVDIEIASFGALRVARHLRYSGSGASWMVDLLVDNGGSSGSAGPVMSPDCHLATRWRHASGGGRAVASSAPANAERTFGPSPRYPRDALKGKGAVVTPRPVP